MLCLQYKHLLPPARQLTPGLHLFERMGPTLQYMQ